MNDCSYIDKLAMAVNDTATHEDHPEALALLSADLIDASTANQLAEVFKALADPSRLRLISLLLDHEVCVHNLEELLGMSQSAVSHQLRHLRQLNLVRFRKEGRHVYYSLDDDHVRDLFRQALRHLNHKT
jgi:DNA-binding transcriptional ArsR family regulator